MEVILVVVMEVVTEVVVEEEEGDEAEEDSTGENLRNIGTLLGDASRMHAIYKRLKSE